MIEEEKKQRPLWRKILVWGIKLSLVVAVLLVMMMTVLSAIGGNSDVLREALQDFVSNTSGMPTQIETLNEMAFFPTIRIDIENVEMKPEGSGSDAAIVIGKAVLAMDFWDAIFKTGQLRALDIEKLSAVGGAILPKPLNLEKVTLQDNADNPLKASLEATGLYGDDPLSLSIPMDVLGNRPVHRYEFPDRRVVTLSVGDVVLTADMQNWESGHLHVPEFTLSVAEKESLSGNVRLKRDKNSIAVRGDLKIGVASIMQPDLTVSWAATPTAIAGELAFDPLDVRDADLGAVLGPLVSRMSDLFAAQDMPKQSQPSFGLEKVAVNARINIKKIAMDDNIIGNLSSDLTIENGILTAPAVTGRIMEGYLSGSYSLDDTTTPPEHSLQALLKDLNLGVIQEWTMDEKQYDADATIDFSMKATGKTSETIKSSMSGEFSFLGGKGQFDTGLLNLWGGGLVNALVPGGEDAESAQLHCVIANAAIEKGVAEFQALFADTERVTIVGKGNYDITDDRLNIQLEPKPKQIALLDVASAVNITGSITNPSISPSVFSLGKKLGGLFLGTINPAFLAVQLTNLGLNEKHPCAEFLEQPDEQDNENNIVE